MPAINVVSFFDEVLAIQGAILASSLAKTATPERPVKFHVFCIGGFQERFAGLVDRLSSPSFSVVCKDIYNPFDRNLPTAYFNHLHCMRLCTGELLDCDRVIYLDADTFVRGSLGDLYDIDLDQNVIAAVKDKTFSLILGSNEAKSSGLTKVDVYDYYKNVVDIKGYYFNSGVMLIDLKKWREFNVKDRCLEYLKKHVITLCSDQDALNYTLGDKTLLVGHEWNFMAEICEPSDLSCPARIIHFSGRSKPWSPLGEPRLFYSEYWQHALATPYGDKLVDHFFDIVSSEKARAESVAALIPSHLHPINTGWAKRVPSALLKLLAENLCTFGKGRVHRTGVALWCVLKARRNAPQESL